MGAADTNTPGVLIWRIEQFHIRPWPAKDYGRFFTGDTYIILNTYRKPRHGGLGAGAGGALQAEKLAAKSLGINRDQLAAFQAQDAPALTTLTTGSKWETDTADLDEEYGFGEPYPEKVEDLLNRLLEQYFQTTQGSHSDATRYGLMMSTVVLPEFEALRRRIIELGKHDIGERGALAIEDGFLAVVRGSTEKAGIDLAKLEEWKAALIAAKLPDAESIGAALARSLVKCSC